MSSTNLTKEFSDINHLELKIREKLTQLQFKQEALEGSQAQLTESRSLVCQLQILLENERRTLSRVRFELKSAMELIDQLEDEKIHAQTKQTKLEMNWQNTQITCDNLVNQARKIKMENILLQRKNEIMEANLSEQKILNQVIIDSTKDLKNQINNLYPTIQSNILKLEQEQKYLYNVFQQIMSK